MKKKWLFHFDVIKEVREKDGQMVAEPIEQDANE